ncbi:MAG: radical SAM protein, partial [Calditrichaeota bacterium]
MGRQSGHSSASTVSDGKEMMRLFRIGIAQEVALIQVIKALTLKRLANASINFISFLLSVILKRPILFGYPSIVNIEPTNVCNLQCPLCITGSGQMKRANGRIQFEQYIRLTDQIAERTLYLTLYHQGEPYLHKQFDQMVAYAKSKRLYVTTSTNGHFFHADAAERVVRSGLDSMIISLDGVTQASYERYRINGDLNKVLSGIRNLTAAKRKLNSKTPYLFLQFLVMSHNEHEIP